MGGQRVIGPRFRVRDFDLQEGGSLNSNDKSSNSGRDFSDLWNRPGSLIRRLHQIHVAIFLDECSEFKVTPVQFGVLTVLYDGQTLDQVTIASQIGVDRNTAADVVRRLERRGLLVRPKSTGDRRAKLAKITEEGKEFVDAVQPAMIKAQERFVSSLDDEDYDSMMRVMTKLLQNSNEHGRAPLRAFQKTGSAGK